VTSPVSWDVAERVATWVGTRGSLLGPPGAGTLDAATMAQLEVDFSEATTRAEGLVIEATGLHPATGSAGALVLDRAGWVAAMMAAPASSPGTWWMSRITICPPLENPAA